MYTVYTIHIYLFNKFNKYELLSYDTPISRGGRLNSESAPSVIE